MGPTESEEVGKCPRRLLDFSCLMTLLKFMSISTSIKYRYEGKEQVMSPENAKGAATSEDVRHEIVGLLELTPEQQKLMRDKTGLETTKITITKSTAKDGAIAVALGNACW